jgi:lipoprotein-anchoring transpeptidase ErfK/SrfK
LFTRSRPRASADSPRRDAAPLAVAVAFYFALAGMAAIVLRGELKRQADTVGGHERAHVRAFRVVLGSKAIKRPHFDFGGATEGSDAFRRTAVAFEDLAVAAYKGQAPHIRSRAYLASALAIHSVEARHAAWIRRLAGKPPVAGPFDEPLSRTAATPDRRAHALRHPQDEPQGAEVHRLIAAVAAATAIAAVAGCGAQGGSGESHVAPPDIPAPARGGLPIGAPEPLRADPHAVQWAPLRRAAIARAAPSSSARAVARLASRTPEDTTNLVLVLGRARDANGGLWIRARLPARRAQTGWLPRSALGGYEEVRTRLIVDRARLTLTLLRNGRAVFRAPVGIGRAETPTPAGAFYVRDRLRRYASPLYGPVAFGTSAQSATLTDWPAGGYVGIHGTSQPELVPGRISHGCIRLRNGDIVRLARLLPVGTPLEIR